MLRSSHCFNTNMTDTTTSSSLFQHIPPYEGDPILSLMEDFQRDERSAKVGLSIGIYLDGDGRLPVMDAVRQAQTTLAKTIGPSPYLPMEGAPAYRQAVQALLFGAAHEAVTSGRIATLQTLGASGALKVGGDFIKRYFPASSIWVSDPTWENHVALFEGSGFKVNTYPYYSPATGALRFDDMLATLSALPAQSVVLLHACCHNPTGVDLSQAQWDALVPVIKARGLIPFIDMAYQGFGEGIAEDAYALRMLASAGVQFFAANSFSKNFSLYGERCGALSVVCTSPAQADNTLGQLKAAVRRNYSSPPAYGSRIVADILQNPALNTLWQQELTAMRERIKAMRSQLHAALVTRLAGAVAPAKLDFYIQQHGMFSYTGLSEAQVATLREIHGIYLVRSGRMCMSGLTATNVNTVAEAVASVMQATK